MSTTSIPAAPLYVVPSGPFKGIQAGPGEIETRIDEATGREYRVWDTHARTRHFLDKFSPFDGWKLDVNEGEPIVDAHNPQGLAWAYPNSQTVLPTYKFTAKLIDKDGHIVNSGTVVQLLYGPMAMESGQTRARSKLYSALGLPASPDVFGEEPPDARRTSSSPTALPRVELPVVAIADGAPSEQSPASPPVTVETVSESSQSETTAVTPSETTSEEPPSEPADAPAPDATPQLPAEFTVDRDPGLAVVAVNPSTASSDRQGKVDAKLTGPVPVSLLRQIKQRAAKANVEVPNFGTLAEASAFLATLLHPTEPIFDQAAGDTQ